MVSKRVNQLTGNGIIRPLTASETRKGYVFISKNKKLPQVFRTHDLSIIFNGNNFGAKKIDASGRVCVGRDKLQRFVAGQKIKIVLKPNNRLLIETDS